MLSQVRRRFSRVRLSLAGVALVFALGALPTTAQAVSSISPPVVLGGEVIVDRATTFSASGYHDPDDTRAGVHLYLEINPASVPCASNESANESRQIGWTFTHIPEGTFSNVQLNWKPTAAGSYLACLYLDDFDTSIATQQIAFTARTPRTSLQLKLPSDRMAAGTTLPLQVVTTSEVSRTVAVDLNPISTPCGATPRTNYTDTGLFENREIGVGPQTSIVNIDAPRKGHYRLCGWIGRSAEDAEPTSFVSEPTFWIGPPPSCRFSSAPVRPSGRVKVKCVTVDGTIEVRGQRGAKAFTAQVPLVGGVGYVGGRSIGLKRGSRVTVSAWQAGKKLGSRALKVKRR